MPAEGIQLLLGIVIVTLTSLLVFVGTHVILILREIRSVVQKMNELLKTQLAKEPSYVPQPSTPLFLTVVNFVRRFMKRGKVAPFAVDSYFEEGRQNFTDSLMHVALQGEQTDDVEGTREGDSFPHITALRERGRRTGHRLGESPILSGRRVFYREGKPLA